MIQEILTWITVSAAVLYTLYSLWKTFFHSNGKVCGGGCPSCEAKDLLIKDIHDHNGDRQRFERVKPIK
ncbi:MAG: FeoB-associated Cys-rich membrane protein [Marinilabilia sp.]